MNQFDAAIQKMTPTVMVPRYEELEPLVDDGYRYLMAANGLWVESKAPWGHVRAPIRIISGMSFPYGHLKSFIDIQSPNKKIPLNLVHAFVDEARKTPDVEVAGWVIYNRINQSTRLQMLDANTSSGSHIEYVCPELSDEESLMMDIHSHAKHHAYFSAQDDADDKGAFKIAVVVGCIGSGNENVVARLCVYGSFHHLPVPVQFSNQRACEEAI